MTHSASEFESAEEIFGMPVHRLLVLSIMLRDLEIDLEDVIKLLEEELNGKD